MRVKDYGSYSFWLENSGDDLTPRPPLDGSTEVDVAILGAGFTGLWTAYSPAAARSLAECAGGGAGDRRLRRLGAQRRLVLRRIPGQPCGDDQTLRPGGGAGRRRWR